MYTYCVALPTCISSGITPPLSSPPSIPSRPGSVNDYRDFPSGPEPSRSDLIHLPTPYPRAHRHVSRAKGPRNPAPPLFLGSCNQISAVPSPFSHLIVQQPPWPGSILLGSILQIPIHVAIKPPLPKRTTYSPRQFSLSR